MDRLDVSPTRVSSLSHITLGKRCISAKSWFTGLYASQKDPREYLQRLQKIIARHMTWCSTPKRCFQGGWRHRVFACVHQTPQNIYWSSRTLTLVFQIGYMGVIIAALPKKHYLLMWNYRLQIPMLHFLINKAWPFFSPSSSKETFNRIY